MTWTNNTAQSETWTDNDPPLRVFDANVFDPTPTFDTGPASGYWTAATEQAETWVAA